MEREFLKKAAAFFASKPRIRRKVRTDAARRRPATGRADGTAAGGVPVRVLRVAHAAAVGAGGARGAYRGRRSPVPRRFRRGLRVPRILADLREDGEIIPQDGREVDAQLGLRGICPRRWRTTTILDSGDTYPPDVAKRHWDTGALNALGRRHHVPADLGGGSIWRP